MEANHVINGGPTLGNASHSDNHAGVNSTDDPTTAGTNASAAPGAPVPTYNDTFPELVGGARPATPGQQLPQWGAKPLSKPVKRTSVTQVFHILAEERRYQPKNFGDTSNADQARICADIMAKTGVNIDMSVARDGSLSVVLQGRQDAILEAKKEILQRLHQQMVETVAIPKQYHRFIIGQAGATLQNIEMVTATKITVPHQKAETDNIEIKGTKEGIERAAHEIQCIADEQSKLATERVTVPQSLHIFIGGPNNQWARDLAEKHKVRIHIPPHTAVTDEIVVSGDRDGVKAAVEHIQRAHEAKVRNCQTVSVEVRKTQHKYVIGPKGAGIFDILENTGVSVEVPAQDSPSESITLRGPQDKLGIALTMLYAKANSVVQYDVKAPSWIHRRIIGPGGSGLREVAGNYSKVHVSFLDNEDKISVEGPPEEAEPVRAALDELSRKLQKTLTFADLDVDPKFHPHLIGKSGSNVTRIMNEYGVTMLVPNERNPRLKCVRLEGEPKGVAAAKKEINELVERMANERSKDILIASRFHKNLIGANGSNIREVRDKFPNVLVNFPPPGKNSDIVQLRGPKQEVDKCYKHLESLAKKILEENFQAKVHIFRDYHKNVIGKGGQNVKKIRDETHVNIDVPKEGSGSDLIVITGRKENVEKAKKMVEAMQQELINIVEVRVAIDPKYHKDMIGFKGRLIHSIAEECGGVLIRFPEINAKDTSSKAVIVRGPKDDCEAAKKQLEELAADLKESSFRAEVTCSAEYHPFLIGRGGANIRKLKDETGARVIFPDQGSEDNKKIIIIGKKDSTEKCRLALEARIANLAAIEVETVSVDPKFHRHFVVRRGEVISQIGKEYGEVSISFPRQGLVGEGADRVVVKGARECVTGAIRRIKEIVEDLEAQVTIDVEIEQRHHRALLSNRGQRVQELQRRHNVQIKFPDRRVNEQQPHPDAPPSEGAPPAAAEGETAPADNSNDIIHVSGRVENCEACKEDLIAMIPITFDMEIPFEFHRSIIGQRGNEIRKLMEDHDVMINIPPAKFQKDTIQIQGVAEAVQSAQSALEARIVELEEEKKDRALRNHQHEIFVPARHHPKLIGRRGVIIDDLRKRHEVNITLPPMNRPPPLANGNHQEGEPPVTNGDSTPDNEHTNDVSAAEVSEAKRPCDRIILTGREECCLKAAEDIKDIIAKLEAQVTETMSINQAIHPRLIGQKGRIIAKIMDDFKVDVRFPGRASNDPHRVEITGDEPNVLECVDHLQNMVEEYEQDLNERSYLQSLHKPSRQEDRPYANNNQKAFAVRDAPWDQGGVNAPDTSSQAEFPAMVGAAQANKPAGGVWGRR